MISLEVAMLTVQEKVINPKNGYAMLALGILLLLVSTFGIVAGALAADIGEMVGFGICCSYPFCFCNGVLNHLPLRFEDT